MTRRNLLTAVELAATAAALTASLPILAHAADYGVGRWAAPALFASVILAVTITPAACLLLLIVVWQWGQQRRDRAVMPPSARTPLWQVPERDEFRAWDQAHPEPHRAAYEVARQARCAPVSGRHVAASCEPGIPAELQQFDWEPVGIGGVR